jgi:phospholipase C
MIHRTAVLCFLLLGLSLTITQVGCGYSSSVPPSQISTPSQAANIQHIVVIFQENVSFDHYFGTYPNALNLPGETPFTALPGTPAVDGLSQSQRIHG